MQPLPIHLPRGAIMSTLLTEEQVLDIHTNARVNGGRMLMHTLCKRHGITINEAYVVLRTSLSAALTRARTGKRFISWEGVDKIPKATKAEIAGAKQNSVLRKHF